MSSNGDIFKIEGLNGEKTLSGEVSVGGAKNAALPALAGSVLFDEAVTIKNVPDIRDTRRMVRMLEALDVTVEKQGEHTFYINPSTLTSSEFDVDLGEKMRASIILTGPILARVGEVTFPHPGGCVIGARPIDMFLDGYEAMGAEVEEDDGVYTLTAPDGLHGAEIFFKVPSHTATETLMMAAVVADGETVLKNCSMEPEIIDVAEMLNRAGAQIEGAGTPTMRIVGGSVLNESTHSVMPDRLEAGSFMILGALCAKNLTIHDVDPEHLELVIRRFQHAGVPIETDNSTISIVKNTAPNDEFSSFDIKTQVYPGYPTDLQAPSVVFLTQASGEARVFETIFEGRLHYTEDLVAMGADITMWDPHRIEVKGPTKLSGRELEGPDIRAGLAFVIAALVASGTSTITNVGYIDRGYEHIEKKLQSIGADIRRESE